MAEKRMFTQKIVDSDAFLDMPLSSQALYFHLNMRADDDGFVNNPKRIQRTIGASEDDLKLLIAKRFLLCFENGVVVIKHWRMHNLLRKDRYNPTLYVEEMKTLELKENGAYTERDFDTPQLPENSMATTWQPNGNQMAHRIGKDSIEENSIGKKRIEKKSIEEVAELFNTLCPSYFPVQALSDDMRINIRDSIKRYGIDKIKAVFSKAEASDFLKGSNGWKATFDWLIQAENIAKVLNGNYDNKTSKSYNPKEVEAEILKRMRQQQGEKVESDPVLMAEAEALKQELQEKYG